MKILASIGAAVLVVLVFLYANGYLHNTDRMKGRNQFHTTGQGMSESEAERQRLAQEGERLRIARETESQRSAQEEERLRLAREAERRRIAQEETERQRLEQERLNSERQRAAQEAERQRKAEEGVEAERQRRAKEDRQRMAKEEAEKKIHDEDLKQCLETAEAAYSANWDTACRQIGGPPKCVLPPLVLARFDGPRRDARDACARLYSAK